MFLQFFASGPPDSSQAWQLIGNPFPFGTPPKPTRSKRITDEVLTVFLRKFSLRGVTARTTIKGGLTGGPTCQPIRSKYSALTRRRSPKGFPALCGSAHDGGDAIQFTRRCFDAHHLKASWPPAKSAQTGQGQSPWVTSQPPTAAPPIHDSACSAVRPLRRGPKDKETGCAPLPPPPLPTTPPPPPAPFANELAKAFCRSPP